VFFFSPSEVLEKAIGPDQRLRIGGLVAVGSLVRGEGATITFDVTDNAETIPATFTGVLPDLFREGQGVIAEGYLRDGVFEADEILAKHDENYMPKEVADALKEKGLYKGETN
jgi:cytochrome c-type biogenesis protein CcmE